MGRPRIYTEKERIQKRKEAHQRYAHSARGLEKHHMYQKKYMLRLELKWRMPYKKAKIMQHQENERKRAAGIKIEGSLNGGFWWEKGMENPNKRHLTPNQARVNHAESAAKHKRRLEMKWRVPYDKARLLEKQKRKNDV